MTTNETEQINEGEIIQLLSEIRNGVVQGESSIEDGEEISIGQLWGIFRKNLIAILIIMLLFGGIGYGVSRLLITPLYTSAVTLYVSSNAEFQPDTAAMAQSEYKYTTEVINTYIEILRTESFYADVASTTGGKYSAKSLEKKITIQPVVGTEIIKISVVTEYPEDSYNIAMTFANLSSGKIESIKSSHNVKIVDPPKVEDEPSNDKTLLNTAIGMMLGVMLTYGIFLVKSMMDKAIRYPEDLSDRFKYPILGVIPDLSSGKRDKSQVKMDDKYNFATKEAYKTLRANLGFAFTGKGGKVVAITSSIPSEGKSTTAVNIAKAIAQTGAKTIVIDCDLRKPKMHKFFDIKNIAGLSNIAAGMISIEDAIQSTKIEDLDIITAGDLPPNPSELLSNENTKNLLKQLKQQYEYVIIDMPPLGVVSDALGVVEQTDGYIVVARSGMVEWPMLEDVLTGLEFAKAPIAGFVLNGLLESKTGKYGYKYHHKYKYKYKY